MVVSIPLIFSVVFGLALICKSIDTTFSVSIKFDFSTDFPLALIHRCFSAEKVVSIKCVFATKLLIGTKTMGF